MERTAVFHRPESEYAYLYSETSMHIRLRTKKEDVLKVELIKGDPYLIEKDQWYEQSTEMKKIYSTDLYDYWLIETPAEFKRLQYAFHLFGNDDSEDFYGDRGITSYSQSVIEKTENYFRMPYFQEVDRVKTPNWVKETVWYQIFPERFANGDTSNDPQGTLLWGNKEHPGREDFFGGDLKGVMDHLDYLVDLGINGIYFCPIFEAHSNHKYDTIDYFQVDPAFGDKKLFKKLVDECHKRGIRVMLDAVFNHMGYFAPQWQDVIKKEMNSQFVDWFHIESFPVEYGKNGNFEGEKTLSYQTFSFTPRMPKLNTGNPEVQAYLLEIATYWIKEFNIDAWRLDVANEVDHQFWKKFYQTTMALKEDFYILGEIWHSSQNWLNGDEFHAVMNYGYTETILDYFVRDTLSASELVSGLYNQLMLYRQQTNEVMFNMLDSHDTARLLTVAGEKKEIAKMALVFTFLQHGSPCLYYGTEIGMTGENDPDCRKCMIWDETKQDSEFLSFTKQLIKIRKEFQECLSYGELNFKKTENAQNVVLLERDYQGQSLSAYFNKGEAPLNVTVTSGQVLLSQNACEENAGFIVEENGFLVLLSGK